jgi:hypothetical protein
MKRTTTVKSTPPSQWPGRARPVDLRSMLTVLLTFTACSGPPGSSDSVGVGVGGALTLKNTPNWTANGNEVPVCWETPGFDREKSIVKDAVKGTWEFFANVRFTGWSACPTGGIGGSGSERRVRVHIWPQGSEDAGAGGRARLGMTALSSADEMNPGVNLSFDPDGTADQGRVEYVGVHEFGHVLGFIHEQDTPGNVDGDGDGAVDCKSTGIEANIRPLTPYDRDSVMNACNRDGNMKGNLTDSDIKGVQAVYGVRVAHVASHNSCASAPTRELASIAWGWNDGSFKTSFALFPSDGERFQNRVLLSSRDGGWDDGIKWFAGDFTGTGRTDVGAAWNDGGKVTLTVRSATGSGFTQAHWAIKTGGWIQNAEWLPGDFNGDGLADVAGIWNDGGRVSIAVFLSDGKRFLNQSYQWSLRDGGWGDTIKWFAGDFNGDGLTDIGAAWNNNDATTLTVRQSTGTGFNQAHWAVDAGNWSDSSAFVAGDFNGDGFADVARLWNDLGRNTTTVYLSTGESFSSGGNWSVRDGGWIEGGAVKWLAGDFNGDGLADIGAAWDNQHLNTLTVRQSTGSGLVLSHWAAQAGGWRDSAVWCSGTFRQH